MIGRSEIERAIAEAALTETEAEDHFAALGVDPDAAALTMSALARAAVTDMVGAGKLTLDGLSLRVAEAVLSAFLVGVVIGREAAAEIETAPR